MEAIKSLFHDILGIGAVVVTFLVHTVGRLGYAGVILLMALESSFVPFPSEVVVPPAGYLASLGQMNIFLVILSNAIFYSIIKMGQNNSKLFIIRYSGFNTRLIIKLLDCLSFWKRFST